MQEIFVCYGITCTTAAIQIKGTTLVVTCILRRHRILAESVNHGS